VHSTVCCRRWYWHHYWSAAAAVSVAALWQHLSVLSCHYSTRLTGRTSTFQCYLLQWQRNYAVHFPTSLVFSRQPTLSSSLTATVMLSSLMRSTYCSLFAYWHVRPVCHLTQLVGVTFAMAMWLSVCLSVCQVGLMCPNDRVDYHATFARLLPSHSSFPVLNLNPIARGGWWHHMGEGCVKVGKCSQ